MVLPKKATGWASFGIIQSDPSLGKRMAKVEKRVRRAKKRVAKFEQGDVILDALGQPYSVGYNTMCAPADINIVPEQVIRVYPVEQLEYPVRIVARHGDFANIVVK